LRLSQLIGRDFFEHSPFAETQLSGLTNMQDIPVTKFCKLSIMYKNVLDKTCSII
jgi:hypothetical protein